MNYTKENIIGLIIDSGGNLYRLVPPNDNGADFAIRGVNMPGIYRSETYTLTKFNSFVKDGAWKIFHLTNWCVLRDSKNAAELNAWATKTFANRKFSSSASIFVHNNRFDGTHYTSNEQQTGYTLVCWEYFRDFIMTEQTITAEPSINNSYSIF
jgi:hypothetical protein